ncbi:MAG: hypothetical protein ACTTJ2_00215 [Anaerovoracaceae bacterium]
MKKRTHFFIIFAVAVCLFASSIPTFAAANLADDPNVTIISPSNNAVMKAGKVLVSVKLTAPETIRMSFYSVSNSDRTLITSETYSSSKVLSYYTRQLSGLNTGVYCINISTLNSSGNAVYATEVYINVKKQSASSFQIDVFNSKGTSDSFWTYLLKRLLG